MQLSSISLAISRLGGNAFGAGASLALDFTSGNQTLDPRINFTRTTTATRTNASGLLESVAINAPRFDYDPTTLAPLGLLIEEQRTNLLTYSTDLSTGWSKGTLATWTPNAGVAPDGTMTSLGVDGISGVSRINTGSSLYAQTITATGSTAYTVSVYVRTKTGTASNICIRISETGGNNTVGPGNTIGTAWQQISLTVTTASGATGVGVTIGTVTGTADLFIWGAQLEAGAFATSYIPTVASQVTRAADAASMTGTNFSSWYNQAEGSFFSSVVLGQAPALSSSAVIFAASDGTNANRVFVLCGTGGGGNINTTITTAGVLQAQTINGGLSTAGSYQYTNAYKANDFASVANGGAVATDTSGTVPAVNRLFFGATAVGSPSLNGYIRKIAFYPRRLSNAELRGITS